MPPISLIARCTFRPVSRILSRASFFYLSCVLTALGCDNAASNVEPFPQRDTGGVVVAGAGDADPGAPVHQPKPNGPASALLDNARARFLPAVAARLSATGAGDGLDHGVLPLSQGSFVAGPTGWMPSAKARSAARLNLSFPERAGGRLAMRDTASALGFEVSVSRAGTAIGEVAEGYLVYRESLGAGTATLFRATEDGFEDYVLFDQAPAQPEVEYALTLSEKVAGLRLVANSLELLDATGTPRLRVSAPFLIGADGKRTEAELAVGGCAVDRNPAPPWGRAVPSVGARDCSLIVTWGEDDVLYPALLDPSWSTTANMATTRAHHQATRMSNGRILVTGGVTTGGTVTSSAEVFDPTTATWSSTAAMSAARYLHTANTVSTNQVVVAGGYTQLGASPTASAQRYNPTAGTWSTAGTVGTARAGHAATRLSDGSILLTGGLNGSGAALTSAQRYNTSSSAWTAAASLATARAHHSSTLLSDGTVLIAGGRSSATGAAVASASRYTVSSNSWAGAGSMAVPRYNHTAALMVVGGVDKVWLAGGSDTAGVITPSTEIYVRGTTATWTRSANMTYPRRHHTAVTVNGRILLTGGIGSGNAPVAISEAFNPAWETLAETPTLATARAYHAATTTDNTHVIVTGGSSASSLATGSTYFKSAEIYDGALTAVHISEHKVADVQVPEVRSDGVAVDLWARYYRPATLTAGARYPLLVFLHGNHASCGIGSNPRIDDDDTYALQGDCPSGYTVVPNHAGYEYIATELAARGYFVVSINANRGIARLDGDDNDPALIRARANLVLVHLEKLSRWHRGLEATPSALGVSYQGRLDLNHIGLMGHSRGGEAVRYAVTLYRQYDNPHVWDDRIGPVLFRSILELAPTDGYAQGGSFIEGTEHTLYLSAQNLKWAVVLPMCDGDVKNMLGIRPFDRMLNSEEFDVPSMKASYTVWGANHNYFNTEWQQSDSTGCIGTDNRPLFATSGVSGSAEQRQAGFHAMLRFFTATVGANAIPQQAQVFIPGGWAPPEPRVERGFTSTTSTYNAYNFPLESFNGAAGSSSNGIPFQASNSSITQVNLPERDYFSTLNPPTPFPKGGHVTWNTGGSSTYLQIDFAPSGSGHDLTASSNLSLRVDRAFDTARNTDASTRFNVQLVHSSGTLSAAQSVSTAVTLKGPVGSNDDAVAIRHSMLQTALLPLSGFTGINRSSVRGVRFLFNQSTSGAIYLADIAATNSIPWTAWNTGGVGPALAAEATRSSAAQATAASATSPAQPMPARTPTITSGNVISAVRSVGAKGEVVEIDLVTTTPFRIGDAALRMAVGKFETIRKRMTGSDGTRVTFKLRRADFDALADGQTVLVFFDDGSTPPIWSFGPLQKSTLK